MTRRAVGVDIGEETVRAVLLTRGRGLREGYRVTVHRTVKLAPEGGIAEGLQTIFADASFRDALWAAMTPAGDVSFHSLQIPFAEERKIRQVLAFEVESLIPSPLEDVFVDCLVNPQERGARVIAAAAPRSTVIERIDAIAAYAGGDGILDCSPVPVASALLAAGLLKGGEVILDIGTKGTAAAFIGPGMIAQIRHYAFGGDGITSAIAADLGISHAEAEELKRRGDAGNAEEAVKDVCASFFAQLSQTLDSLWWNGDWGEAVARIILTGGGAFYSPLARQMGDYFAVPVDGLDLARAAGVELGEDVRREWQPYLMDQALALALRAEQRQQGFNFTRLVKEQKGDTGIPRSIRKWAAGIAALALVLGAVDFTLAYRLTRLRLEDTKRQVAATFKQYAPEITRIVDPVQQLTVKVNEAKRLALGLAGVHSGMTLIGILREFSALVPPSVPLLITTCLYEGDTVIIKGETQNFDAVNAIKNGLEQSRFFAAVAISSSELMKKEGKVSFEMKMTTR